MKGMIFKKKYEMKVHVRIANTQLIVLIVLKIHL